MDDFGLTAMLACIPAVWRLTNLLARESGPGNLMGCLREAIESRSDPRKEGSLGDLLSCHYCLSVWVSFIILSAWIWCRPVVWWLDLSAGAILIHEILDLMTTYKAPEEMEFQEPLEE